MITTTVIQKALQCILKQFRAFIFLHRKNVGCFTESHRFLSCHKYVNHNYTYHPGIEQHKKKCIQIQILAYVNFLT